MGVSQQQIGELMRDEASRAWELYEQNIIREIYVLQDRPGVVTVFECASLDEVKQISQSFPLVQKGLIEFDFMVLGPFTNYAKLFT